MPIASPLLTKLLVAKLLWALVNPKDSLIAIDRGGRSDGSATHASGLIPGYRFEFVGELFLVAANARNFRPADRCDRANSFARSNGVWFKYLYSLAGFGDLNPGATR